MKNISLYSPRVWLALIWKEVEAKNGDGPVSRSNEVKQNERTQYPFAQAGFLLAYFFDKYDVTC